MRPISNASRRARLALIGCAATLLIPASPAAARSGSAAEDHRGNDRAFEHVATFDVMAGNRSSVSPRSSTARATADSSSTPTARTGEIGFVDIADPVDAPAGSARSTSVVSRRASSCGGTSCIVGGQHVRRDFTDPSGDLVIVGRFNRARARAHRARRPAGFGGALTRRALAGGRARERARRGPRRRPDPAAAVGRAGDRRSAPQADCRWRLPAPTSRRSLPTRSRARTSNPSSSTSTVDNQAVVSFQENNHLAVVDLYTGQTIAEFSAGEVALSNVDTGRRRSDQPRQRHHQAA